MGLGKEREEHTECEKPSSKAFRAAATALSTSSASAIMLDMINLNEAEDKLKKNLARGVSAFRNLADFLLCGRIDCCKCSARDAVYKLIVDEEFGGKGKLLIIQSEFLQNSRDSL